MLARAQSGFAAGKLPEGIDEEVELHAPVRHDQEPAEIDPETESFLREQLSRPVTE